MSVFETYDPKDDPFSPDYQPPAPASPAPVCEDPQPSDWLRALISAYRELRAEVGPAEDPEAEATMLDEVADIVHALESPRLSGLSQRTYLALRRGLVREEPGSVDVIFQGSRLTAALVAQGRRGES